MEDLCLEAATRRLYGTLVLHCIDDNFAIYDLSVAWRIGNNYN